MDEGAIELPSAHNAHNVHCIPSGSSFSGSSDNNHQSSSSSGGEHPHVTPVESNIINVIDNSYNASLPQIVFLGLGIVLGGTVVGWNKGVEEGFWAYFISYAVIAIGYLMLVLCLAELTSIMAFAGGAYGYIRCAVSPFLVLAFHIPGGRYFWLAMTGCAILTVITILLYCLAAIFGDPDYLNANITSAENYRIDNRYKVHPLHQLYLPAWFFIGSETLILAGAKIANGTQVIPKALTINFSILILLATWVLFTTVAQYHDGNWKELIRTDYPLSYGLHRSLQIPMYISPLLTLLPNYSSALGFMYAAKHSMQSMALSGLFPAALKRVYGSGKIPLRALLTCTGLQLFTLIIGWGLVRNPPFFELCMLAASCSYIGIFTAYIVFRKQYAGMERSFHNPLGVYGAYTGICVFILVIISIIGFRVTSYALPIFVLFLFCMTLYYYFIAESRQGFSIEEQKRFMRAYILNSNNRRKKKTLKHPKAAWYKKVWDDVGRVGYFLLHWHCPSERVHVYNSNTHAPSHPYINNSNNSHGEERTTNNMNRSISSTSTQLRSMDPMHSHEGSARSINTMMIAALAALFHTRLQHHQAPAEHKENNHSNTLAHRGSPSSYCHHYSQPNNNTNNPPSLQTPTTTAEKQSDAETTINLNSSSNSDKKNFFSSFFPHKTLGGGLPFSTKFHSTSNTNNLSSGSSNSSLSGTQQTSFRVASSGNSSIKISIRHSSVPPASPSLSQASAGNGLTVASAALLDANVDLEAGNIPREEDDEYLLHRCSTILSEKYVPASGNTSGRSHSSPILVNSMTETTQPHGTTHTFVNNSIFINNNNNDNSVVRQSSQTFSDMSSCPLSYDEHPATMTPELLSSDLPNLQKFLIDSISCSIENNEPCLFQEHYHQQHQHLQGMESTLHVEDASSVVSGASLPPLLSNRQDVV